MRNSSWRAHALVVGALVCAGAGVEAGSRAEEVPEPWYLSGDHRMGEYAGRLEPGDQVSGELFSKTSRLRPGRFGTIARELAPGAFRGKRVRLRARLRSQDVGGWCGLWMRVDSGDPDAPYAFDNMDARGLRGSQGWTEGQVVLDVPAGTTKLAYGFLMEGPGRMWVEDLRLEPVGLEVPSTDQFQEGSE